MPAFQGSADRLRNAETRARAAEPELDEKQAAALQAWTDEHAAERSVTNA